jgi:hypothetical protein
VPDSSDDEDKDYTVPDEMKGETGGLPEPIRNWHLPTPPKDEAGKSDHNKSRPLPKTPDDEKASHSFYSTRPPLPTPPLDKDGGHSQVQSRPGIPLPKTPGDKAADSICTLPLPIPREDEIGPSDQGPKSHFALTRVPYTLIKPPLSKKPVGDSSKHGKCQTESEAIAKLGPAPVPRPEAKVRPYPCPPLLPPRPGESSPPVVTDHETASEPDGSRPRRVKFPPPNGELMLLSKLNPEQLATLFEYFNLRSIAEELEKNKVDGKFFENRLDVEDFIGTPFFASKFDCKQIERIKNGDY